MSRPITRRAFVAAGAAATFAAARLTTAAESMTSQTGCPAAARKSLPLLEVRPYQLMCIVCRIGEGRTNDLGEPRLTEILQAVRANRKRPVALRCNVDTVYCYQNPGHGADTPEGELFNAKRDLDILQKLGLVPGDTRPAVDMFQRLLAKVPMARGICAYDAPTSDVWKGCPRAASGHYEKGLKLGIGSILPPRDPEEKAKFKKTSAAAVYGAKTLQIRPHHLLCMSCFFGRSKTPAPLVEDNLFEAVKAIQKAPEIPVRLIAGCCMICPPCSAYDPNSNLCLGGNSMALRDQKKDLDVLQRLGLAYGDTMPARQLYELIYSRIPSTRDICGFGDGEARSPEWSICDGAKNDEPYQRARAARLGIPAPSPTDAGKAG